MSVAITTTTNERIKLSRYSMDANLSFDEMHTILNKTLQELQDSQIGNRHVAQRDHITKLIHEVNLLVPDIKLMANPKLSNAAKEIQKKAILQAVYMAILLPYDSNCNALKKMANELVEKPIITLSFDEPYTTWVAGRIRSNIIPYLSLLSALKLTPVLIEKNTQATAENSTPSKLLKNDDTIITAVHFIEQVSLQLQRDVATSLSVDKQSKVADLRVNLAELVNLVKSKSSPNTVEELEMKRVLTAVYTTILYPTPDNCKALQKISTQVSGHGGHFWKRLGLILLGIASVLLSLTFFFSPIAADGFNMIGKGWGKTKHQGLSLATEKVVTQIKAASKSYTNQFFQTTERTEKVDQAIAEEVRTAEAGQTLSPA